MSNRINACDNCGVTNVQIKSDPESFKTEHVQLMRWYVDGSACWICAGCAADLRLAGHRVEYGIQEAAA